MLWAPNLQLYFPLENQANDYSGNARHGTVFGDGVYATRPNAGRCLYFDGTGDYVRTPSFGLSGAVVVVACWVRCKLNASRYQSFLGGPPESATVGFFSNGRVINSNSIYWSYADGTISTLASAPNFFLAPYDDAWVHATFVCDYPGKAAHFFRNAKLFASAGLSRTPLFPSQNQPKYVGCFDGAVNFLTAGYLDEVTLWTLATMPSVASMTANVNRIMLGLNPIW